MNKQKGNMYDFVTHTWNPLAGKCDHNCIYCSTNKFFYNSLKEKYSGPIRIVEKEFNNLGKGNTIFVCAQHDLFAKSVSDLVILKIIKHCQQYDNQYLFQSKNPKRFIDIEKYISFPDKSILATTIESNRDYKVSCSPTIEERKCAMMGLCDGVKKMVTIEPIMDFDVKDFVEILEFINPDLIAIGANTYDKANFPEPPAWKIHSLIQLLQQQGMRIHLKDNLKRLI